MTETPEIPTAARKAFRKLRAGLMAVKPHLDAPYPDDARWTPWTRFVETRLSDLQYALSVTEPSESTFTASEVKELTTKATEVALALGRKEAATEVAEAIRRSASAHYSPGHDEVMIPHETAIGLALEVASRVPERGSEPLTAPTGHSDLPPTPEAATEACKLCLGLGGIAPHLKWSEQRGKPLWTAHEYPSDDAHPTYPCPACSGNDSTSALDLPEGRDQ